MTMQPAPKRMRAPDQRVAPDFPHMAAAPRPSAAPETVDQCCSRYRRLLMLPAVLVPQTRRIIVHRLDGLVDAVVMPSRLGEKVAERLSADKQLGPVIEHPRSHRCTLLTGPADGYEHEIFGALLRLNVAIASNSVVLPSPDDEASGFRCWIFQPCNGFRPAMRVVLDTVLEATA
jgi:hypothetical protein